MDRDLTLEEQKELLRVSRQRLINLTNNKQYSYKKDIPEGLGFKRGAFVTLNSKGRLRGCIGNFVSNDNLLKTVLDMSVQAGSKDPRFPKVTALELDDIDIEISVLSPLRKISDVDEIEVGKHGIFILHPHGRGVLLPQVATEYGWNRTQFLEQTCLKAGLPTNTWQEPEAEILIFSAQVFGEKGLGLIS